MVRERRKFERYPCAALGSCVGDSNAPTGVKCYNISAAGVGIASSEFLPVSTYLRINLCTNKDKPLLLKGIVRWCNKTSGEWQSGIEFAKKVAFPLAMVV